MRWNSSWLVIGIVFLCNGCSDHKYTASTLPLIVKHDCIDLNKIDSLILHADYDNRLERNAVKLLYIPSERFHKENVVEVYSPVDGTIVDVYRPDSSNPLKNVSVKIQVKDHEDFFVVLGSVDLNSDEWGESKIVKAGMHIGYVFYSEYIPALAMQVYEWKSNDERGEYLNHSFLLLAEDYVMENYRLRGIDKNTVLIPQQLKSSLAEIKEYEEIFRLKPLH